MILLEFAAQGVRGVSLAGGRAALRPGYNVVAVDGPLLRRLLEALLNPASKDPDDLPRSAGGPANVPLRAGLTVVGDDGVTYRMVRDFSAGCQFHRFDPAQRSFALVSQDLEEIAKLMRKPVGAPAPARLAALLSLSAADLPSKQGGVAGARSAPSRQKLTPEQARKRISALEAELERAKIAEKLQYRLDGLQQRTFKLDESLGHGRKIREGLEKAEAERRGLGAVAAAGEALGDPDAKIAGYEQAAARRDEALARVEAERSAIAEAEARGCPAPPWSTSSLWYGVGAGALAFVLGGAGALWGPSWRYMALLGLPAFGWSAWVGLRWVASLEAWERIGRRRRALDDWERKMLDQFERDAADVRSAMKALDVTRPEELREHLGRLADADSVVAEWRRRLQEWQAEPANHDTASERKRVDAELQEVEAQLSAEAGGFVRDVRSIEQEIRRLEHEAVAPAPPPEPATRAVTADGASDPIRALLERAAGELGHTPASAGRAVAQKASQALSGLSFQRLAALSVDDRGNVQVQVSGRPSPALSLPPADKDLVFLALKLAFMEHAFSGRKGVAISEDAFAGLSDGAKRFAARLLKQIARGAQIVHATSDPAFREVADHAA